MENTSQPANTTTSSTHHSEGKVIIVAALMFIFGGMIGNMLPYMSATSQKGSSIESQENYEIAIRQIEEEESSKDAVITDSRIEMREFQTVITDDINAVRMNPVAGTSVSTGGGVLDRPYKCTDFNGGVSYLDLNSNEPWLVWTNSSNSVIGSCVAS